MGTKKPQKLRKNDDCPSHSQPNTSTGKRKRPKPRDPTPDPGSSSESSPPSSPASVRLLLEPYSKPGLVALLAGAAAADTALLARVRAAADASRSHHRVFVHGLPPHADGPALEAAFGPHSGCHVFADRASGRCRGYGFLTFLSRSAARRAVCAPCVVVAGRPVSALFASADPDPFGGGGAGRRLYVTNVVPDASAERLRVFFARFGELEGGPFGFDAKTGWSRGYALFLYRATEDATRGAVPRFRGPHAALPARRRLVRTEEEEQAEDTVVSIFCHRRATLRPVLDAIVGAGAGDLAMYARNPAQAAPKDFAALPIMLPGQNPVLALSSALASGGVVMSPAAARDSGTELIRESILQNSFPTAKSLNCRTPDFTQTHSITTQLNCYQLCRFHTMLYLPNSSGIGQCGLALPSVNRYK